MKIFFNRRGNLVNPFLTQDRKDKIVILERQFRQKGFWALTVRTAARIGLDTHHDDILFKKFFVCKGFRIRKYNTFIK